MAQLKNRVPALLAAKGVDIKTFVAKCMLAGLSNDTAYRLAGGRDTNFTSETLAAAAGVLQVESISELIDLVENGGQ